MIKVLYDDEIFSSQTTGGVSRYFSEVISHLDLIPDVSISLPLIMTANEYIRNSDIFHGVGVTSRFNFKGRRILFRLINRLPLIHALRERRFDVFHFTYYDVNLLKYLEGKAFVITIHDLIPELFYGSTYSAVIRSGLIRLFPIQSLKRQLIERAARIVAVSLNTKNDLVRLYGAAPDKVDVIHPGVGNSVIYHGGSTPRRTPECFILITGRRWGYKNFLGVARSIGDTLRAKPDLHLLCVGGGQLTAEEMSVFESCGCSSRVIQMDLTDAELAWAYAHAVAFVFPSLYEGFGIPILEAFANGCPTILSNRSCFPEIGDEAALFFDPDSPSQLETLLRRVVGDCELRRELAGRARVRLRDFSWTRSAQAHAGCYIKAADG